MTGVVGITQRTLPPNEFGESRYALDSRWFPFLAGCGLVAVPLPNQADIAVRTACESRVDGLVFSGGDDLACLGGPTPERDETERALLNWAMTESVPVLGVCRGAQLLLTEFGTPLTPVAGHVAVRHALSDGRTVNSYHRYAARSVIEPLRATAWHGDVVEAFEHTDAAAVGVMWHPEREEIATAQDVALFRRLFGAVRCAR